MTRHAFDAVSFAFGARFLLVGVLLLSGTQDASTLEWVGPMAVIGLGVLILVATVPRRRPHADDGTTEEEPMAGGGEA
jgi:cytochrome c-type biogenesis protein CcmH/NrfF